MKHLFVSVIVGSLCTCVGKRDCCLQSHLGAGVATVVRYVTSGSDTSGFVLMSRESPRKSHVRTGSFIFEFFAVYRQTVLNRSTSVPA